MEIKTLVLGPLNTNCYLLWDEPSLEAMVIDPADEGDLISEEILRNNLQLKYIVLTHGHFDHIMGLLELKLNFPQAQILVHEKDLFLLESLPQRAEYWLKRPVDPAPKPDAFLQNLDYLKIGNYKLKIIHTPGHTPGSICLYNDGVIFTGDTLFADGNIGRSDFSYSSPADLKKSLQKISKLANSPAGERKIYSGH